MNKYAAVTDGPTYTMCATLDEAIRVVEAHEDGEVIRTEDDMRMYVKYPTPVWV